MEAANYGKKKILCLHGFRTSGSFLKMQISKWDPSIFAPFVLDFTGQTNLEACIDYLCNYMETNGPFHGLLGFSQGAALSALLLAYQAHGMILKQHPPIALFVSISGSKFKDPAISEVAYKELIKVRSVHFVGERDWQKLPSEKMAAAFDHPLIICHPQGHTVPRIDEETVEKFSSWIRHGVVLQRSINVEIKHGNRKKVKNGQRSWLKGKL
ncbi:family of serine hydrolases 2-like isoform X3 [Salvia hispanica]|uniref:family of serine hydrolases 2-like isoform X3 n=1 Tax=Salvia hispanica TaxID=49212 RepID=UPI0020098DFE|nr:family of serine hydrolases 2-like isoform X3 [Salvia hispanica]